MTELAGNFEYENGGWKSTWQTPAERTISIYVFGDPDFMRSPITEIQLQGLMKLIDECIDIATNFANDSVYQHDISEWGAMRVESVVVKTWAEIIVWFCLGTSWRMLGVRLHEGKPMDVYCEH